MRYYSMMSFIPWEDWQPSERATLCFIVRNEHILLIHKKRGFGAGKINGPGGRLERGETPLEAAIRETQEELGVTPLSPRLMGELHFQFVDGYSLFCSVFLADDCYGEPIETDEAIPVWTKLNAIPYERMWADDCYWLPGMLEKKCFRGYFHFEGEQMLSRRICWGSQELFDNQLADVERFI